VAGSEAVGWGGGWAEDRLLLPHGAPRIVDGTAQVGRVDLLLALRGGVAGAPNRCLPQGMAHIRPASRYEHRFDDGARADGEIGGDDIAHQSCAAFVGDLPRVAIDQWGELVDMRLSPAASGRVAGGADVWDCVKFWVRYPTAAQRTSPLLHATKASSSIGAAIA